MDLPSPPVTPCEHTLQKLSTMNTDSAPITPPCLDVRSYRFDQHQETLSRNSKPTPMSLKRRSKSEENLTTLMHRNVFRNSQRNMLPAQLKSPTVRPSVRRRHSSCVEMNTKESMRIATIYGWVTTEAQLGDSEQSSAFRVLSNIDNRTSRRALTTTDHLDLFLDPIHPLDKVDGDHSHNRQRTRSTGWTDVTTKPNKSSLDTHRTSSRRSLYATRSVTQPTPSSGGKFSKLLIRRRKLARIPISRSLPSLLAPVTADHFQTAFSPSYIDDKTTSVDDIPTLPTSPTLSLKKEANQSKSSLSTRNGKSESIIDVLIAAAAVHDDKVEPVTWLRSPNIVDQAAEPTPEPVKESLSAPEQPLPPVENDPHVFDLLEKVNSCVINYITPTQSTGSELGSPSIERVGSNQTAGVVISAATIEKLIEKLTSDLDSNFLLDFFLTYRQFITSVKLCKLLILRFRWAVMEETEVRRLVRIRTFVVLRYWMTYFWSQDFRPSRMLRFILSTFLSQLRAHPSIVDSDRDTRIIRNLRTIFKKQRKMHSLEQEQGYDPHNLAAKPLTVNELDEDMENSRNWRNAAGTPKEARKDSAIGMPTSHHKHTGSVDSTRELKSSLSTPVVPILKRSRRLSENSQRGVNDSNEWTARFTFGLRSMKRTVPAMYRSLVEGISGNTASDDTCKCGDMRVALRLSGSSDDMVDLPSYKTGGSRSDTLSSSYRDRRVGKSSSHIEKSSANELRLYAPRPRPSQSLTEAPRNYSDLSGPADSYQTHPNPACPHHLSVSPPSIDSTYLQSSISKAKSFSTDIESATHGSHIDTTSIVTLRSPQKPFILQHRSEIIMQQFCIIEKELLERVTWVEIVEMRWKKTRAPVSQLSANGSNHAEDVLDCHIDAVIEWFNITYIWVISEIVSVQSLDLRVQVIEKLIRVALKCYHHRNYSTLLQILLGLQSPYVSRLSKTWHRVDQYERQIFEKLKDLPNPERNWKRVRNCMISAVEGVAETQAVETILSDSSSDQPMFMSQRGSIPFLGLYLADMTSNAEMPTFIPNSMASSKANNATPNEYSIDLLTRLANTPLVNYNKFRITASVVKHVLAFQLLAKCYQFERYEPVYEYLKHMIYLDNNDIRDASLQCEE